MGVALDESLVGRTRESSPRTTTLGEFGRHEKNIQKALGGWQTRLG